MTPTNGSRKPKSEVNVMSPLGTNERAEVFGLFMVNTVSFFP